MKKRVLCLIKIFDNEAYADAFINHGEMFCRTLTGFKNIDDEVFRGDRFEGVTDWFQSKNVSMNVSYKDNHGVKYSFPVDDLVGPVVLQSSHLSRLNAYCMYAMISPEYCESYETEQERVHAINKINKLLNDNVSLSDEVIKLGGFAVVVYRVGDFILKVKNMSDASGFSMWNGLVNYYNPDSFHGSFDGIKAVFNKRSIYEHQSEYRFVFDIKQNANDKLFSIGSLNGLAFKIPTNRINDALKLEVQR